MCIHSNSISSNGGTPETLATSKSEYLVNPQILPDGKSLLYTAVNHSFGQPRIMAKSLESEELKEIFAGSFLRYLPSGHMVYWDGEANLCVEYTGDRLMVQE
jgi:hypothetical protein